MDHLLSQQLRCSGLRDWSQEFRGYTGGYIADNGKEHGNYYRVWG